MTNEGGRIGEFLLAHGGPFYDLQRQLGLLREDTFRAGSRALLFVGLAWGVPLILSLIDGNGVILHRQLTAMSWAAGCFLCLCSLPGHFLPSASRLLTLKNGHFSPAVLRRRDIIMPQSVSFWVKTSDESLRQFADTWHQAEQGEEVEPFYSVGFESMAELISTLTPKRWELIESLHREGPMSIYALAKLLQRDYKNVHTDVKALSELEIIQETGDGKVTIPWDEIEAHFKLAA